MPSHAPFPSALGDGSAAFEPVPPNVAACLAQLAGSSPDLVAIVEQANYSLEYINDAGRELLGLSRTQSIAGRSLMEFIPSECLWTLLNDGAPTAWRSGAWRGELALRRVDGTECPVAATLFVPGFGSSQASTERLALVARDATSSQSLITGLKNDQRLLRALLENLPDEIYFKDRAGRYLRVSHAMATKFGLLDPHQIEGRTDADFFTAEHAQAASAAEQEIIRTERPVINAEEREAWADGRVTWVATTKLPFYNEFGQAMGTFGLSRDITARKNAEIALLEAQRSLQEASKLAGMAEVASGVLHNIGNVFNSVNTSAAVVADHVTGSRVVNLEKVARLLHEHEADLPDFLSRDARGRQLPAYITQLSKQLLSERETLLQELESLRQGVDHIKNVITMQQSYAHASSLAEDLHPVEVVEEALRISEVSLSHHKIAVVRAFSPTGPVHAARHKILQILVNLIRNAKHAMDDRGGPEKTLTITVRAPNPERVEIAVADTGVGISAENLAKLFVFGFTTKKNGHGFGLHSSALAAQEMDGQLTARSEGPGRGAEFVLQLPAKRITP